jgi:hypothetical protein
MFCFENPHFERQIRYLGDKMIQFEILQTVFVEPK